MQLYELNNKCRVWLVELEGSLLTIHRIGFFLPNSSALVFLRDSEAAVVAAILFSQVLE